MDKAARLSTIRTAQPIAPVQDDPLSGRLPLRGEQTPGIGKDRWQDSLSFRISPLLCRALETIAQQGRATSFDLYLAALMTLVYRYTGEQHISVRSLAMRRARLGSQADMYAEPVTVEVQVSDDLAFDELLARVHHAVANPSYRARPTPATQDRLPLSQRVAFAFGAELIWNQGSRADTRLEAEIEFRLTPRADELEAWVRYNAELYTLGSVARMIGHYQTLLAAIATHPDESVGSLPLLTAEERRQILVEWNATEADYPDHACAHSLFEAQVERTPEAPALVYDGQILTFRELDERANQLALLLQGLGVGPDVPVGICIERSPAMVVGLLGVLKAGGAYVPLDPTYPRARLASILDDAQVPVLLTQQHLAAHLPSSSARRIYLDPDWRSVADQPRTRPISAVNAQNLAYIIYTSGSTGKPKGVMIEHRGLVNYLSWAVQAYASREGKGAPIHSPLGFDLTVTSLFCPLLVGQPIVLIAESEGVQGLGNLLKETSNFGLLKLTPAHLDLLRHLLSPEQAARRADVFVIGGEALTAESLAFWRKYAPDTRLINEYGPTETVVGCCIYEVNDETPETGPIPIGRPIANTRLYILDRRMNPVPVGVVGELYIGGAGVARGYLHRPELTCERFIPDPFVLDPGERMYRTGDLARYRADGIIEFLGRSDDQVKLRGFRIELGEIEAALGEHPSVEQAVVAVKENGPGDKVLAAYVVPRDGRSLTFGEMRAALLDKLPEYMVPSALVLLQALPLSVNGKVDRRALPLPRVEPLVVTETEATPSDLLELKLLKIWQEHGLRATSVDDNFFELGGHSLLGLRLFATIRDQLGERLPLPTLFAAPTIKQLAERLRQEGFSAPAWSSLVAIQPNGSRVPVFFVHPVGGDVLGYANLARHLGAEQPFYGLRARGLDGAYEPDQDIKLMAQHYISEILTVQPNGPFRLGGYSFGGIVAFEMACQLQRARYPVELVAILDADASRLGQHGVTRKDWGGMLRNLPYWIQDDLFKNPPARTLSRARKKVNRLVRRSGADVDGAGSDVPGLGLDEMFDLYAIPEQYHAVWKASAAALENYDPEPFPGRITLFRVRTQPLFGPFDPLKGWQRLARQGVEIRMVPGPHDKLLVEPYVTKLARQLKASLT